LGLVIGWDNEMTMQCEGTADIPTGADRDRCLQAYLAQYPDGVERAHDRDIVHVRVRPSSLRYSDYRPRSFTVEETTVGHDFRGDPVTNVPQAHRRILPVVATHGFLR
jgi:hypothetical protein